MSAEKDEMALEAPTSEALYGCLGRFDRLGRKSSLISGGDGLPPPQPRNTSQSLASQTWLTILMASSPASQIAAEYAELYVTLP